MKPFVEFAVYGVAQPRGSKRSLVPTGRGGQPFRKNGRIVVSTVDSNPKSKDWMRLVAREAGEAMRDADLQPTRLPVALSVTFYRARPKGHFGSGRNAGRLKPSSPAWPATKPDMSKLLRAVEDALSGVVYHDDAQIVAEQLVKDFDETPRIEVSVVLLEETAGARRVGGEDFF